VIVYINDMGEQSKFWHIHDYDDLEMLHAHYITHSFDRHIHEGYAIGVIEQGAEAFYYRGKNHVAPAGSVVVIDPGEIHTGHAVVRDIGWTYRMLYPGLPLVEKITHQIPIFENPVIHDTTLAVLLQKTHQVMGNPDTTLERDSYFHAALHLLTQRYAVNRLPMPRYPTEQQAVRRVRAYLEDHYAENITLDELTLVAGLTPSHLVRTFKQQIGLPPHQYLVHVRIERAKDLLKSGSALVQVALETGFTDQSHFTRRFKRVVGVTPGHFVNSKNVQDSAFTSR
jgi:AraC-like DNA-binding protein